jgi:hypothetical protein
VSEDVQEGGGRRVSGTLGWGRVVAVVLCRGVFNFLCQYKNKVDFKLNMYYFLRVRMFLKG